MTKPTLPSLRIVADDVYCAASEETYKKAAAYLQSIKDDSGTSNSIIQDTTDEMMIHTIFGSNYIERAGLGQNATTYLCRQTLNCKDEGFRSDNTPDIYVSELKKIDSSLSNKPSDYILRGRQEVIQHVRAYQHFLHHFATLQEDVTEDLIKETHKILCSGVPVLQTDERDIPSDEYRGVYRKAIVGAGNTNFVVPHHVPRKMAELCKSIQDDLHLAETASLLDPFSLAAKHSLEFVQIHPFLDGNGRMCRIILNAILFRFCHIFVAIGESEEDRIAYLNIKKRASQDMEGHGEYADFVLIKAVPALRKMKQKIHGKGQ